MARLVALTVVAFFTLTSISVAHDNDATAYRAKLAPVGVATAPTGEAVVIDGKNHNIAMIEATGLTTGTSYPWHVHSFAPGVTDPCAPGTAQGPIVTSFTYGALTGNEDGDGFAQAPSPSFDWGAPTNQYYVNIHNPVTLAPIACGVLTHGAPTPHRWGGRADVYRAKLAPVGVATTPTGEAVVIDGTNHNIAMIEATGLTTGTSYPWHVHSFAPGVTDPCAPGTAQGPIVTSFTYGALTGNEDGDGFAQARSPSFDWGAPTNQYYVNIHNPVTLAPIACGVLTHGAPTPQRWGTQRGFAVH